MLSRIKKNDLVVVLSGRDKGKTGQVVEVDTKNDAAVVKGVSIVTKHQKAKKAGEKSRIVQEETAVLLSKLMPVCTSCKKACRVQAKFLDDGKKVRTCHKCKEIF